MRPADDDVVAGAAEDVVAQAQAEHEIVAAEGVNLIVEVIADEGRRAAFAGVRPGLNGEGDRRVEDVDFAVLAVCGRCANDQIKRVVIIQIMDDDTVGGVKVADHADGPAGGAKRVRADQLPAIACSKGGDRREGLARERKIPIRAAAHDEDRAAAIAAGRGV